MTREGFLGLTQAVLAVIGLVALISTHREPKRKGDEVADGCVYLFLLLILGLCFWGGLTKYADTLPPAQKHEVTR